MKIEDVTKTMKEMLKEERSGHYLQQFENFYRADPLQPNSTIALELIGPETDHIVEVTMTKDNQVEVYLHGPGLCDNGCQPLVSFKLIPPGTKHPMFEVYEVGPEGFRKVDLAEFFGKPAGKKEH